MLAAPFLTQRKCQRYLFSPDNIQQATWVLTGESKTGILITFTMQFGNRIPRIYHKIMPLLTGNSKIKHCGILLMMPYNHWMAGTQANLALVEGVVFLLQLVLFADRYFILRAWTAVISVILEKFFSCIFLKSEKKRKNSPNWYVYKIMFPKESYRRSHSNSLISWPQQFQSQFTNIKSTQPASIGN